MAAEKTSLEEGRVNLRKIEDLEWRRGWDSLNGIRETPMKTGVCGLTRTT
jgi:hypothetical protein